LLLNLYECVWKSENGWIIVINKIN
jgi:hypothetical protein